MKARALVPLKDLVDAKSRLSGLLRPAERRALAQAMAEDVLLTLNQHPDFDQLILLSDDPAAAMLAEKYGAEHWPERALGCRGLNEVIAGACDRLFAQSARPVVVLHADLPCLEGADLTAILAALSIHSGLIVACDRHGVGTNLLAFGVDARPEFLFGLDSCAKHCASAEQRDFPSLVVHRPGIALDIDVPEDIQLFIGQIDRGENGFAAQVLLQTKLWQRIRAQLNSMLAVQEVDEQLLARVNELNG